MVAAGPDVHEFYEPRRKQPKPTSLGAGEPPRSPPTAEYAVSPRTATPAPLVFLADRRRDESGSVSTRRQDPSHVADGVTPCVWTTIRWVANRGTAGHRHVAP